MRSVRAAVLAIAVVLAWSAAKEARGAPPGYTVEAVQTGLRFPTALRFAPDGRLFYLERDGHIMVCADSGRGAPVEWATVAATAVQEEGLLGIDFHPDFIDSPYVYVFHATSTSPSFVARMSDAGGRGTDYALLYTIPRVGSIHVGGRIAFGMDRMLYVSSGNQFANTESPQVSSLKGKILRLTPMGEPAPGNPYPANPVVAAVGLRNPFGLCFDPADGTGYLTENGGSCNDELNRLRLGADYGWPLPVGCGPQAEGTELPIWLFQTSIAPTGCCVYRGAACAELDGDLFLGSWNWSRYTLRRAVFRASDRTVVDSVVVFHDFGRYNGVSDVTVGPDGLLWISTVYNWQSGTIWRVLPPPASADASALRRLKAPRNPFTGGPRGTGPSKN